MEYKELIKNIKILLADDDEDYLMMTDSFLKQIGYNVELASDGKEAADKLKNGNYQIALLDYFMPGLNGEEVIEEVRKNNKEIIIILQTGFSGQKPPIETMQKLNIQNYYDKTEGIDKLNLELTSAVKIFNQQNEIELTKFKTNTIGELMNSIAEEIKSDLLSIGAGIEVTNMMISDNVEFDAKEEGTKLKGFYEKNKMSLEKIDKVLDALISETKGEEKILSSDDILLLVNVIVKNAAKKKNINFVSNAAIKSSRYINGNINEALFVICYLLNKIIESSDSNSTLDFTVTEDESNWIIYITPTDISKLNEKDMFLINMVINSIKDVNMRIINRKIEINIIKK